MISSLAQLPDRKRSGPPLAVLTCYDYPTARLLDDAGIDLMLVGDSLSMVVLGLPDTTGVTKEDMLHHTRTVCRAKTRAPIIADLPFHSYTSPGAAVRNAKLLVEPWFRPPFAKARADVAGETLRALREYVAEVRGE